MNLQQHPLSAAFPAMSAEDFQALTDSIENIGVQNPITLYGGMVIDGWHRYRAATGLGMECPIVELGDVDPRDFVMAQNKVRRHITVAQLAMAANAVYQWRAAGRPAGNSAGPAELKQPEIAKNAGVSVRSLRQADEVAKNAAPVVIEAISRGDVGLEKAAAISKLPKGEQAAAIHKPAPKPPKTAPEQPPEDDGPSADELATQAAAEEADRALVATLLDSDAPLAALAAENKQLKAEIAQLKQARDGYMNRCNEAIALVKSRDRQIAKLEQLVKAAA